MPGQGRQPVHRGPRWWDAWQARRQMPRGVAGRLKARRGCVRSAYRNQDARRRALRGCGHPPRLRTGPYCVGRTLHLRRLFRQTADVRGTGTPHRYRRERTLRFCGRLDPCRSRAHALRWGLPGRSDAVPEWICRTRYALQWQGTHRR